MFISDSYSEGPRKEKIISGTVYLCLLTLLYLIKFEKLVEF